MQRGRVSVGSELLMLLSIVSLAAVVVGVVAVSKNYVATWIPENWAVGVIVTSGVVLSLLFAILSYVVRLVALVQERDSRQ